MEPTIATRNGRLFDLLHPYDHAFDIEEIAHALSHICRFTGHTRQFYSVAQHSVGVSALVPPEHALAGLLHDAAEAYVGDVSGPLKRLLPDYKEIERHVEGAVLTWFGLPRQLPPCVKQADLLMLATEQYWLMPRLMCWTDDVGTYAPRPSLSQPLLPLPPERAREEFLQRYYQLAPAASVRPTFPPNQLQRG